VASSSPNNWRAVWTVRTGVSNPTILARTRLAVEDMEGARSRAADLSILSDSRIRRLTHSGHLPEASWPGEVTHMDVFSSGKHNQPTGADGRALNVRYTVIFIDGYSRYKDVLFCDSKDEVGTAARTALAGPAGSWDPRRRLVRSRGRV
jgi:hypothetical protein